MQLIPNEEISVLSKAVSFQLHGAFVKKAQSSLLLNNQLDDY